MKVFFIGVAVFIGLFLVTWAFQGNDFLLFKVFAPKQEQVRREVFEQSKAYNQGMVQELQNMQLQYVQADSVHKDAIASIILQRTADYDLTKLPSDLRSFVQKLKDDRLGKY